MMTQKTDGGPAYPQKCAEEIILRVMTEMTPSDYEYSWFMPIRYVARISGFDFPITRGFLHSLKMRGFVEFGRGFDEDGMVAGSGYTVTPSGKAHFETIASSEADAMIAASDAG